ncbi:MAG: hypothetical protein IKG87_10950 [Clostridia bacterium]|nr:hypothetical protein [Clostridia bacterium]
MTEITTFRLSTTGLWQYEFCRGDECVGSVVSFSPREPVRIEGENVSWYSSFNMDTEIIPGVSRKVMDNRIGEEIYRIIWWRPDLYEIRAGKKSIQAEIRNGSFLFGQPMMPVTAMTGRTQGAFHLIRGLETESMFRSVFFEPVSPEYRMMVLSFPALRFC